MLMSDFIGSAVSMRLFPSQARTSLSEAYQISWPPASQLQIPDLTARANWAAPKPKIKELAVDDKWSALEQVGLQVGAEFVNKNLLLIDDMYQSGATAHFVGSHLRGAGADEIHLLAVSKGRRDTDNT